MSTLNVESLSAGYGAITVLHDISFSVEPGEIVGLLGRNGAGKTTTLLALGGFLSRVGGTVTVNGVSLQGPAYRRARGTIGIVFEGRSVFPGLSVRQNLSLAKVEIDEALTFFPELSSFLNRRAGGLSGGEQQMLALARAIGRGPAVLLIDEVSFGLSPLICERIFDRLRETVRHTNTAIVVVEQHLNYAAMVVDRALVMNEGIIRMEVPGDQITERAEEIERIYLGTSLEETGA